MFTFTIEPEVIYGKGYAIPQGYEAIDFRPPRVGEQFLVPQFYTVHTCDIWMPDVRLILNKIEKELGQVAHEAYFYATNGFCNPWPGVSKEYKYAWAAVESAVRKSIK